MADAIHGDWGFAPTAKWLAENYAHYRPVSGGHLSAMFHLNEELFEL